MSISDRLDEIEARADAATEGPWKIETHYGMSQSRRRQIVVPGWMTPIAVLGQENPYGDPDAEFIAHARADVPWLIEQVRKREAALRAVLAECEELDEVPEDSGSGADAARVIRRMIAAALGEES